MRFHVVWVFFAALYLPKPIPSARADEPLSSELETPALQFLIKETAEGTAAADELFARLHGHAITNAADSRQMVKDLIESRDPFAQEFRERLDSTAQLLFEHQKSLFGITDHKAANSELDWVILRYYASTRLKFIRGEKGVAHFASVAKANVPPPQSENDALMKARASLDERGSRFRERRGKKGELILEILPEFDGPELNEIAYELSQKKPSQVLLYSPSYLFRTGNIAGAGQHAAYLSHNAVLSGSADEAIEHEILHLLFQDLRHNGKDSIFHGEISRSHNLGPPVLRSPVSYARGISNEELATFPYQLHLYGKRLAGLTDPEGPQARELVRLMRNLAETGAMNAAYFHEVLSRAKGAMTNNYAHVLYSEAWIHEDHIETSGVKAKIFFNDPQGGPSYHVELDVLQKDALQAYRSYERIGHPARNQIRGPNRGELDPIFMSRMELLDKLAQELLVDFNGVIAHYLERKPDEVRKWTEKLSVLSEMPMRRVLPRLEVLGPLAPGCLLAPLRELLGEGRSKHERY
jgi:hypothetical protein